MKKISLLFVAILFFSSHSNAQEKAGVRQKMGYIGISAGFTIPTGDYASKDKYNAFAGFADAGKFYDLSFTYNFDKGFGICAKVRAMFNPMDEQTFLNYFSKGYPFIDWAIESKNWEAKEYLVGTDYSIPMQGTGASMELKAMIGILSAASPEVKITATSNGVSEWEILNSIKGISFCYLAGVGFKFNLGKNFCLLTNFDYSMANPEFTKPTVTTSSGVSFGRSYSQSIGTFNLGAGLGIRF